MLEYIRNNAQSFGIKIAFGVIILVFVFWGVGSMRDPGGAGVLATVNGKPLLAVDYEMALRQMEENVQRNMPNITKEQLRQLQIPRQVLQQLVVESLLLQEAARLDITVTPLQMRLVIEQVPMFHNDKGQFDPEIYKRVLSTQRSSLARYESGLRKQMLEEALFKSVTAAAYVSPEEVRSFFMYIQEKRDVEYIFFPATPATAPAPAEDEVRAWYESNRAQYAVPPKVAVEYVLVRPADLAKPEAFSDAEVKAWYDKNLSRYREEGKEEAKPLDAVKDEIRQTLAVLQGVEKLRDAVDTLIEANILGKALAETAKMYGLEVTRSGLMSAAELESTLGMKDKDAQTLLATPVNAPVDMAMEAKDNGFLVARVVESVPAGARAFEEVKAEIVKVLTTQKAATLALSTAADARKQLDAPATAKAHIAKAKKVDGVQRGESLPVLGQQPAMIQALFTAAKGEWLPVAYEAVVDNAPGAVLVRVAQITPPAEEAWKPLEETVRNSLEQQRRNTMFQTFIEMLQAKAQVEIKNQAFLQQLDQM